MPLHREANAAIEWMWTVGWVQYVGQRPTLTDPISPGPSGGFSRPAAAKRFRQHLRAAGCPETYNGHRVDARVLRRCFSTYLDTEACPRRCARG